MHNRVSVNPMAMLAVPFGEEAAALVSMGARRIGVASRKLDERGWTRGLETYQAAGLEIAYMQHAIFTQVLDTAGWASESDLLLRAVETAAEVGAPFVYFSSGPVGTLRWEDGVEALHDRLSRAIERGAACGVDLALENTVSGRTDCSFVFTLRDAVAVARDLDICVCADLFGCWLEPRLRQTLHDEVDLIRMVQVSDRDLGSLVQPDRRVPGDGDLPLDRLITDVLDAGYPGLFDLELLGPQIEAEGPAAALGRAVTWLDGTLNRLAGSFD